MSKTIDIVIPKDAAARHLCDELHKMRQRLATMGLQARILDQVSAKLKEHATAIEHHRADRPYVIGFNDGHEAAFATGIPGDE